MADNKPQTIRGVLHWAKIIGDPVYNKFSEAHEWSFDLTPVKGPRGTDVIKTARIADKLKTPKDDDKRTEKFLTFRQRSTRVDKASGEVKKNKPIRIVDIEGNPWPEGVRIGNESVADVKFTVNDYGTTKGVYVQDIRVLDFKPFEGQPFEAITEDDEYFGKKADFSQVKAVAEDTDPDPKDPKEVYEDDLDDEIPFD